ncbi:MAG: UDP-N-acetylmuramoyl-L-alanyl-D-glutamate--2,6-diaminopimelate ligase [Burkholderiales bacterium]|nr:UDP-N-acetylmuramoyl-L-alanyl-D-glutamate--2,6-diaminopimelate ligase [Burkholderiales bacterium]
MKKVFKKIWWRVKSFVVRYYYGNPSKKLKIIGVTGTNGKTTTATLLYKVATDLGHKAGLISTVENIIGFDVLPHDDKAPSTTPDSVSLTKLFKKMVDADCEYVFMEVSSHALDQNRVAGVRFTGGVFTNLTHDHLDYHKDLQNYFKAKKKFFEMLQKDAFALSNIDDDHGEIILDGIKAKNYFYRYGNRALFSDFFGEIKRSDFSGLGLEFHQKNMPENRIINTKLLGKFNAYNLLAVWSVCKLLNFDTENVNKSLENIMPPKGRFEHFMSKDGVLVVVDYAHTPDALENVLSTIKEIKKEGSRVISVFGCGGDRDPIKRPKMGKIGASLSDIAIFTSDNPRGEDPEKIIENMKDDLTHEENNKVITIVDRRLAIEESVKLAKSGDIVLCAGKGHEDYQEIKGVKNHFDDIEEYKKVLK